MFQGFGFPPELLKRRVAKMSNEQKALVELATGTETIINGRLVERTLAGAWRISAKPTCYYDPTLTYDLPTALELVQP